MCVRTSINKTIYLYRQLTMLAGEETHFASLGLPQHTFYRKNVIADTTWFIYDWDKIVTCVIQVGGSIILNDYTARPVYTSIHRDIESAVNIMRLIFMPANDQNRSHSIVISRQCHALKTAKWPAHRLLTLVGPLHEVSREYLLYLGYKLDEQINTTTISW